MSAAALLLDLDGTLVDSEPLHRAAYDAFLAARGWSVDASVFTGRRAVDVFGHDPGPWAGLDPVALSREVTSHLDPGARPVAVPGAADAVRRAVAAGVPVAVVTSAGPDWVRTAVGDVLGVLDLVTTVVTHLDVTDGKPHPECYLLACARLGVDAATTVAVEDSPAGIASARAAGVGRVVGITTTWPDGDLLAAGAHEVVADLHALHP